MAYTTEQRKSALLVSAHYDSVVGTLAAADDGQGVAVLMESLRAYVSLPAPSGGVVNPVIWNFNGAEVRYNLFAPMYIQCTTASLPYTTPGYRRHSFSLHMAL